MDGSATGSPMLVSLLPSVLVRRKCAISRDGNVYGCMYLATQTRTDDNRTVCTSRAVRDPGRERQMMMIIWSGLGRNVGRVRGVVYTLGI